MRRILFGTLLVVLCGAAILPAGTGAEVRIYLPQGVRVTSETIQLGSICVVRCDDAALAAKVQGVALGRSPWSQEQIAVDRAMILSRLSACGVASARVEITGADRVMVGRDEKVIAADEIIRVAEAFLQENRPGPSDCLWKLYGNVSDLPVPMAKDIRLEARLVGEPAATQVRLEVVAKGDGKELGKTPLIYTVMYRSLRALAARDLPAGSVLTAENVRVETLASATKPQSKDALPYGYCVTRAVTAGTVLTAGLVESPRSQVLVKRGQGVRMRVQAPGFIVTAAGEALQDGRGGEYIKVRNIDTNRVVVAKVALDGTVEPTMGEAQP